MFEGQIRSHGREFTTSNREKVHLNDLMNDKINKREFGIR